MLLGSQGYCVFQVVEDAWCVSSSWRLRTPVEDPAQTSTITSETSKQTSCVGALASLAFGSGYLTLFAKSFVARELEIMHELYERVMPCAPAVEIVCGIIAELDWFVRSFWPSTMPDTAENSLLSFAQASLQYNYTRPNLTEENVIVIQGGRYALSTLAPRTLYPSRSADDDTAIRCTSRLSTALFRTTRTWSVGWVSALSKTKRNLRQRRYMRTRACWIRLGEVWS